VAFFGKKLNYARTEYKFSEDRLEFDEGFFNVTEKVVEFRDVKEVTLRKSIFQRIYDLGTIYLATDATGSFGRTMLFASKLVPVPPADAVISILPHLAYMAFCAGFVAVLSWNVGNKILTPLNGVLFMNVVPLTSFAISALQGLVPTAAQILGAGLTCLALIGNNLAVREYSS